ncbi:MAG: RNA polymerase subunit sigma-24 [Lachnospiraceae bacterium]|nr:RNA polymerase subunit sigma-24 [Lachnospiraceae bacterium]
MKNFRESDYALNKYSQGIVYKFADSIVEVTLKDYLRDNPNGTEADFAKLKAWSDRVYHEQAVQEQRICRRNVSIDQVPEAELAVVPDFGQNLIGEPDEGKKALNVANKLLHSGILTKVQQRRFVLHYFKGLSTRQIAMLEGVRQQTVWESLMWAEKN